MNIIPIKTVKGRDGIEVNKFRYRKDKTLVTGEISWRCTNKKCSASLKTNNAMTSLKSKPSVHNHEPPDTETPSSPSVSEPSTPTASTPSQTPSFSTKSTCTPLVLPLEAQTPPLTEILSPYTSLTPDPPKFPQLDQENEYLRQRIAELVYTNEALTNKLIDLEKQVSELNSSKNHELPSPRLHQSDSTINP